MNSTLRIFQGELDSNPDKLALSNQAPCVSLGGDLDVKLATVHVGVDQVATNQVGLGVSLQVVPKKSAVQTDS